MSGIWHKKAEYKYGKLVDETSCIDYYTGGLEFKEEIIVTNVEENEVL